MLAFKKLLILMPWLFPVKIRVELREHLILYSGYTDENADLFQVTEKVFSARDIPAAEILEALQKWHILGVIEIWESFDNQRNNPKAKEPIRNERAYLGSLLKSGNGRKTPEQRTAEKQKQGQAQALLKSRADREQTANEAEQVKTDWEAAKLAEGRRLVTSLSEAKRSVELFAEFNQSPSLNFKAFRKDWETIKSNWDNIDLDDREYIVVSSYALFCCY